MSGRNPVLAVVWDFDKTLISHYMQDPIFSTYGVDSRQFWSEVNALPALYQTRGIQVNAETVYLNHLLTYVRTGRFAGLTNARLRELGQELTFFPGIPDIFEATRNLTTLPQFADHELKIEHYIVSTGLAEMIRGSRVAAWIEAIWGCELLEATYVPDGDRLVLGEEPGCVTEVAATIDNTTKTRALFEISKGVTRDAQIHVNQPMTEDERRVPLANMVYIADGPSDVPAFSVVRKGGGKALAVYRPGDLASFNQARRLQESSRVDHFVEADYRNGANASMWLLAVLQDRAQFVIEAQRKALHEGQRSVPRHGL